jgi:hypothetical protein
VDHEVRDPPEAAEKLSEADLPHFAAAVAGEWLGAAAGSWCRGAPSMDSRRSIRWTQQEEE